MNVNRPIPLFILLLLICAGRIVPAQSDPGKGESAMAGGAAEVALEDKEIDRIARYLADFEKAREKDDPKSVKKALKTKEQLLAFLEKIRSSDREPLKAIGSWWSVFTHPKYHKFDGRSGFRNNQRVAWTRMGKEYPVTYHRWVSSDYRAHTASPLVLCLHPRAIKLPGVEYLRQLWSEKETQAIPVLVAPEFPGGVPAEAKWSDRSLLYATMGVLGNEVIPHFNLDWNRWFLDGYGDSGVEAWRLVSQYGDLFAGVIIRGALPPEDIRLEDFGSVAFLLIGVPGMPLDPEQADKLGARMKEKGIDVTVANLSEEVKLRREREAFKAVTPAIVSFLARRRNPYPEKIDWSVKENHTRRCFYVTSTGEIEAEAIEGAAAKKIPPSYQVTADRAANKLVFKSHRILGFEVWLNDRILDLQKDVTCEVNGQVIYNGRPQRNFNRLYDTFLETGDWTRIYPWKLQLKVPPAVPAEKPKETPKPADKPEGDKPKPAAGDAGPKPKGG